MPVTLFPIAFALFIVAALAVIVWRFLASGRHRASATAAPNPSAPAAPPTPTPDGAAIADYAAQQADTLRALYALALGAPVNPVAAPVAVHDEILACAQASLVNIADKPNYAPRRPMLLPKLVQAMNDDDVSRRELSGIIAGDPALAGNLLRLANSPFYRVSAEPIESLDRAVAVLGVEGMRSLISAALLQPVFRISGAAFAKFGDITWRHTVCAANAAEAHAAILENSDPFAAQLLALMMGLATVVVFRVANDEYLSRRMPANAAVITRLLESHTASVARNIAASWDLSERMTAALGDQQLAAPSSLGRSLQFGRFLGALVVLREHAVIDEAAVLALFKAAGGLEGAYQRIWARLVAAPQQP